MKARVLRVEPPTVCVGVPFVVHVLLEGAPAGTEVELYYAPGVDDVVEGSEPVSQSCGCPLALRSSTNRAAVRPHAKARLTCEGIVARLCCEVHRRLDLTATMPVRLALIPRVDGRIPGEPIDVLLVERAAKTLSLTAQGSGS